MFNTIVGARAVRAGAASHYGSGSNQIMWLRLRNTGSNPPVFSIKFIKILCGSGSGSGSGGSISYGTLLQYVYSKKCFLHVKVKIGAVNSVADGSVSDPDLFKIYGSGSDTFNMLNTYQKN
jgi:hypothetical protein